MIVTNCKKISYQFVDNLPLSGTIVRLGEETSCLQIPQGMSDENSNRKNVDEPKTNLKTEINSKEVENHF